MAKRDQTSDVVETMIWQTNQVVVSSIQKYLESIRPLLRQFDTPRLREHEERLNEALNLLVLKAK